MDKILFHDHTTLYENAIVHTPSFKKTQKQVRLIVDSRERNITLFPNPNAYEINLLEDLNNVTSMSLLHAEFPFDTYLVNSSNNVLILAYNNVIYTVQIDIGNYTAQELATELTTLLNTTVGSAIFLVEYNVRRDNFIFRCEDVFGLVFKGSSVRGTYNDSMDTVYPTNSCGRILGFGISNYASLLNSTLPDKQNVINSEFKKNFNVQEYIVVHIEEVELNKSTSNSLQNSFAIVSKNNTTSGDFDNNFVVKYFTPPLKRLHKMRLSFVDFYGNLMDFQNQDHRMEILVTCDMV